jgi:DhnA family fructose-bisphosphate aldolase class Ia
MLMHSSGQWVSSGLTIPSDKLNAHGYGSAATYARRFGLQAIAGIAPIDDDGNAAVETTPKTDPAIMKAAKTAAECGADAFRKYWASIPQNIRAQLRDHISELQAIAKTADEENNQSQARQNDD